ncbi:MAG TPA: phytanoyl-CoA dioxygenase family protein [Rhizomicrobium sp.]|jgi:hypothetical protein
MPTLTAQQLETFADQGVLNLKGLISPDRVRNARERVQKQLEKRGLWKDGAWHLEAMPRPKYPATGLKTSKVVGNKFPEIEALLDEPALNMAVDGLLEGREYDRKVFLRPQVLFTMPNADTWTLPCEGWHSDSARLESGSFPGMQLFAALDAVEPGGGATLAIAGSHRLDNGRATRPSELPRKFGHEPFFRALYAKDRNSAELLEGTVGNIPLKVIEMTGAPGDVWLLDLRIIHCGAPNAAKHPRMMFTYRYMRADLMKEVAATYGWNETG